MRKTESQKKLDEVLDKIQSASDHQRQKLQPEFFAAAIGVWNELADDTVIFADEKVRPKKTTRK